MFSETIPLPSHSTVRSSSSTQQHGGSGTGYSATSPTSSSNNDIINNKKNTNSNSNGSTSNGLVLSLSGASTRPALLLHSETPALESSPSSSIAGAADENSGLETRFNLNCRGFDCLDALFGRGWSVNASTGIIAVSDAAFRRVTNPDPFEKWYTLDPEPIARGQFAAVYRCQHRVSGVQYAAKFACRRRHGTDASSDIKHEVAVGAMLAHCHRTVRIHDVFATDAQIVLLMEFAPGGDLQTLLDEDLVPYERDVIGFLRQLIHGLVSIHELGIVHLDIKPQNLVLMGEFPDCAAKLCDFEISRLISHTHQIREILGTPDYVAPEIIHYEPITTKTDMWSLGVLTYVLLTGFLPFGGDTDQESFLEISRGNLDFPEELFEDISGQAINFIQRLLVRCPSQRLSAMECLDHPWMKAEIKKSPVPVMNLPITSQNLLLSLPNQAPQPSKSSTMPNTPTANWNILDDWANLSSNYVNNNPVIQNNTNTPNITISNSNMNPSIMSPVCMTPTLMSPLSSSPRESSFPPQKPYVSYRPNTSAHSSTHSLYKGGSRQNLDRLRSQSKSREVLVERLQMSSQKKTVSRSKERLYDGHYALTKSREHLLNNRSFSHSVEELLPYDYYTSEEEINKSLSNVYMLPLPPAIGEESFSRKLYRSLISIEKIDEVAVVNQENSPKTSYFDSRLTVNSMTDDEYSNYLSRFYPVVRSKTEEPQRHLPKSSLQGGRNSQPCDRRSSTRENNQSFTSKHTITKRNKPENSFTKNNYQKKKQENETIKKDRKKQQKETPKTKPTISNKLDRKPNQISKQNNSSEKRRGSVSHIEQRIQERHERMQEKHDKQQKKTDKKLLQNTINKKEKQRRHSEESDKSRQLQKSKDGSRSTATMRRNSFPARKPPNFLKKKNDSQTTSPSTSLESVKEVKNLAKNSSMKKEVVDEPYPSQNKNTEEHGESTNVTVSSTDNDLKTSIAGDPKVAASNDLKSLDSQEARLSENRGDLDEAYVSLEDTVDDGIFSRSESMDSTTTIGSDNTLHAHGSSSDTLDTTFQDLLISETEMENSKNLNEETVMNNLVTNANNKNMLNIPSCQSSRSSEKLTDHLTIIKEDDDDDTKSKIFTRSVSTSSDIGSMLSEGSDLAFDEYQRKISLTKESSPECSFDPKSRNRSNSIQTSPVIPAMPFKLSRSNSVHLDTPLSGVARPWGEVCQGSVFRALTMFRQSSTESTSSSSGSSTSSRRRSSNWSTAEGLDQIIEKIRSDDDDNNQDITVAPLFKITDVRTQKTSLIPTPPPLPSKRDFSQEKSSSTSSCTVSPPPSFSSQVTLQSPSVVFQESKQSSSQSSHSPLLSSCVTTASSTVGSKSKLPVRPSSIPIRTRV
uniref:Serine/threonine-protein kinase PKH3-like n=2 Tax=Hirondellea gigas TaxID=1518452 RepID=A0A6A7FYJ9_9CRUS